MEEVAHSIAFGEGGLYKVLRVRREVIYRITDVEWVIQSVSGGCL